MRISSNFAAWLIVAVCFTAAPGFANYTIRNLGTQLGHTIVQANGLNDKGWIVGYTSNPVTPQKRPFLIKPPYTGMQNLGTIENYTDSQAYAINAAGIVVGTSFGVETIGWLWSNGAIVPLPALDEEIFTITAGINDQHHVVGISGEQAYLYLNGEVVELAKNPISNGLALAVDINNNDIAVGYQLANGAKAVKWVQGAATIIPTLGGNTNEAKAIAENGLIVGVSDATGGATRAFSVTTIGTPQNLGSLGGNYSAAFATNGTDIVGYSNLSDNSTNHAFIFTGGIMIDLNDFIPGDSGWVLQRATGINAHGQICGYGTYNGATRAFLMTPQPPVGDFADWDMTAGQQNWTAVTNVPPFEPAESQWVDSIGYGLRATAFPSFAFLQSPEITLLPGKTYRIWCTIATTATTAETAPQIRLRAFQTTTNMSEILALDSVGNALPSLSSMTYEYTITTQISGPAQTYRFYLDYTFFNPFDEQAAWAYLQRVIVAED